MFLNNKEKNMKALKRYTLIHSAFLDADETATEVAVIDLEQDGQSRIQDLETIFRLTNNIDGSWSQGSKIWTSSGDCIVNEDYDERVCKIVPLPVHKGRRYGLRSTSVGDHVKTDCGELWICCSMGWKQVDELVENN